eukprot:COSAG02_NODE_287_length_25647_cov_245.259316_6_plen_98_part_00
MAHASSFSREELVLLLYVFNTRKKKQACAMCRARRAQRTKGTAGCASASSAFLLLPGGGWLTIGGGLRYEFLLLVRLSFLLRQRAGMREFSGTRPPP